MSLSTAPSGVHPNVSPVSPLLGRWVGAGRGVYPTIQPFDYREELTFANTGKPFVTYTQKTWIGDKPMHEENGFVRFVGGPAAGAKVEALITQASGVQEVLAGSWNVADSADAASTGAFTISLVSTQLTRSPSARPPFVTEVARSYTVDPQAGTLTYVISMATDKTTQIQEHLRGTLNKQ